MESGWGSGNRWWAGNTKREDTRSQMLKETTSEIVAKVTQIVIKTKFMLYTNFVCGALSILTPSEHLLSTTDSSQGGEFAPCDEFVVLRKTP